MDHYVYAVGGYDGRNQLSSVERYDTETNTWEFVPPMNVPRSALSVAVINGKLYALGRSHGNVVSDIYREIRHRNQYLGVCATHERTQELIKCCSNKWKTLRFR